MKSTAYIPVAPPRSQAAPLGLFYPHGIWAPGVKFMRQLGFGAKVLAITLFFSVPVGLLAYHYFSAVLDQRQVVLAERQGVAYIRATLPLMQASQQLRALDDRTAAGVSIAAADRRAAADSLGQRLQALIAQDAESGVALGTGPRFQAVQQAAEAQLGGQASPAGAGGSVGTVGALLELIKHVSNSSGLVLDPAASSFHLIRAAALEMPDVNIAASQIRRLGTELIDKPDPQRRNVLVDRLARLQIGTERMSAAYADAFGFDATLEASIQPMPVIEGLRRLHRSTTEEVLGASGRMDSSDFYTQADTRLGELYAVSDRTLVAIDGLLAQRAQAAERDFWISVAVIVVFLSLAQYLFFSFYLVTRGGLRLIIDHLHEMAVGDLRRAPSLPWGRDEPAQVIVALRSTYDALHELIHKVRQSAGELHNASTEISEASTDLSARTEATAAALEEQAATMEEIGSTVSATAARASTAATLAADNARTAQHGGEVIQQVVSTMRDIQGASRRIGDIIGTIDGIAFQTNILALNAAVEAARAGEQGRGFAVVASEVRSLAQRSASAAKEIKSLISESVNRIDGGMRVVEDAGRTIEAVVDNARQVNQQFSEIASAAQEQAAGVAQIGSAIQELDRNTQQNAALVEQTNAAAMTLRDQADGLQAEIGKFRLG